MSHVPVQVKPQDHKLLLEVYDENRITRDDFLGQLEVPLTNLQSVPRTRTAPRHGKNYKLQPRR